MAKLTPQQKVEDNKVRSDIQKAKRTMKALSLHLEHLVVEYQAGCEDDDAAIEIADLVEKLNALAVSTMGRG